MTAMRATGHDTTATSQSLVFRRGCRTWNRLMPRPRPPGRLASHRPPPARTAPRRLFSRPIASKGGKAMAAVHYYLGRPARVWISAQSRRRPARPARTGSGPARSGIPGQPATGSTPSVPAAAHGPAGTSRRAGNPEPPGTAASGLPPPRPRPRRRPAGPPPPARQQPHPPASDSSGAHQARRAY